MGGPGSGNHGLRYGRKTTVEECLSLGAGDMQRGGIFNHGGRAGRWAWTHRSGNSFPIDYRAEIRDPGSSSVRLTYWWRWGESPLQHADYSVRLSATALPWGGVRWRFICPLVCDGMACCRRVGKLYLPPGAGYFGCRHCYRLTYQSCQDSHKDDALFARLAAGTCYTPKEMREALRDREKGRR